MPSTPSKRKQFWQQVIVYTTMVVVVIGTTIILFLLMIGYRFNSAKGEFEQGGLAQFVTRPTGATVTVGSAKLANRTPSKITLNPGSYDVKMELKGYRPWTKDISIRAGQVLWLNTVRFVPEDPKVETAVALDGFDSMAARQEGNLVTMIEDAAKPVISVFDIGRQEVVETAVTMPETLYSAGQTHQFSVQTLSENDRFVLVRHVYDGKVETLAVDIKDMTRSQVVKVGESPLTDVLFDPRSGDRVYGRTAEGAVYSIDLPARKASAPLATGAEQFSFVGSDLLLFTTRNAEKGIVTVSAQQLGQTRTYTIETLKTPGKVLAAGGYYYGDLYIAAAVDKKVTLWKTADIPKDDGVLDGKEQTVVNQIVLKEAPTSLAMKGSGRFVYAEQPANMTLYDIELEKATTSALPTANRTPAQARWLDEYHYWYQSGGELAMSEFDGSNVHQLADAEPATDAVLSSSGRYLYSVGRDDKGALRLQRTIMIIE